MWERKRPTGVRFGSPFPLPGPPGPHTRFVFQEGKQVLPWPLLPHHCALQVRERDCGTGGGIGGDRDGRGRGGPGQQPRGEAFLIPAPLSTPCAHLPGTLPSCPLHACHQQPVAQSQHAMSF